MLQARVDFDVGPSFHFDEPRPRAIDNAKILLTILACVA
jgi:hypothetical protein